MKQNKTQRKEYITRSEEETFRLAKKLSQGFKGIEVVFLIGELGSGKTIFAKGLAAGLGLEDFHQVCSPSYTLVNIYQGKHTIFHIDLYRLGKDSEVMDLGWEDYLGQGVIIVEWAEKVKFDLDAIRITLRVGKKNERIIGVAS
jgi:tRNA threonylcarbamoyladenosine biosynthesis protein TsaE